MTTTVQAEPHQFEHVAQRLRDARDDAHALAERTAELTAAGIAISLRRARATVTRTTTSDDPRDRDTATAPR